MTVDTPEHISVKTFPKTDPRLDWVSIHDRRSLEFPVRRKIGTVEDKPRSWRISPLRLDQRREGACVGFGETAELLSSPRPDPEATLDVAEAFARRAYRRMLQVDEYPGEADEGTSVNAGNKVMREQGFIEGWDWCFGVEDVRDTTIAKGPVVVGVPWYESMYRTRKSGLVEVNGDLVGGHCFIIYGYHPSMRIRGEDWHARFRVFKAVNSWGPDYGVNGTFLIRYEDMRELLAHWGEACIHTGRKIVRLNEHQWREPVAA